MVLDCLTVSDSNYLEFEINEGPEYALDFRLDDMTYLLTSRQSRLFSEYMCCVRLCVKTVRVCDLYVYVMTSPYVFFCGFICL